MKEIIYAIGVTLLFCFSACSNKQNDKDSDTFTSGVIRITADESFQPVIQQEVNVFEKLYPLSGILPEYVSETEALNLLMKDSVRLAITTRELSREEIAGFNERKFFPRQQMIAVDGIALITHISNPDTMISVNQVKQILTGKISNWREIAPQNRMEEISVVFDNPNSSTVRFMIDSICKGDTLSSKLFAQQSNAEVIDYVSKHPEAIGVIGVSWLGNKSDSTLLSFIDNVRVMSVSRQPTATPENSYKPYQAYIALKQYPLTRSIYVLMNDPRGGLPTGFFSFLCSEKGQRIILKSGILPATQPLRLVNTHD